MVSEANSVWTRIWTIAGAIAASVVCSTAMYFSFSLLADPNQLFR